MILAPGSEFIGGKVKGVVDLEPSRLTKESDETTTQSVHDCFVRSMRFEESERRESKRISEKVVLSAGEIVLTPQSYFNSNKNGTTRA